MYDDGDILLFTLSARRNTPWAVFKNYFDTVHRRNRATTLDEQDENASTFRWRALRVLRCLGHIDLRFNSGAIQDIVVAPPVLAELPGFGLKKAVLCGARSPSTTRELRKAAAMAGAVTIVRNQYKTNLYAPTRVEVQAESDTPIRVAAEGLGIRYATSSPARMIAEASVSLLEYYQRLVWAKEEDLNWHREDFDLDTLGFRKPAKSCLRLRLSRYQDPVTSRWRYRLWRDGQFSDVDLDWGRFAILAMYSRQVLRYDQSTRMVFVPCGTPLPVLLARALGLCSGYAPEYKKTKQSLPPAQGCLYEVFRDVPPSIFNTVACKIEGAPI